VKNAEVQGLGAAAVGPILLNFMAGMFLMPVNLLNPTAGILQR
jgi:hypothetical protein